MNRPENVVIIDGARTSIGSFGGMFKDVPAHTLGAAAVSTALDRSGVNRVEVSEVVMGRIGQVGVRRAAVFRWATRYNTRRRHSALGQICPIECDQRSARLATATLGTGPQPGGTPPRAQAIGPNSVRWLAHLASMASFRMASLKSAGERSSIDSVATGHTRPRATATKLTDDRLMLCTADWSGYRRERSTMSDPPAIITCAHSVLCRLDDIGPHHDDP